MIQGLLGRHPDMMGSWGPCWLLNFRYLGVPEGNAGWPRGQSCIKGLGWEGTLAASTHASRQTEDFTRFLHSAFLKHSIWNTRAESGPRAGRWLPYPSSPWTYLTLIEIRALSLKDTVGLGYKVAFWESETPLFPPTVEILPQQEVAKKASDLHPDF